MSAFAAAGGGFLLAVLWFDLMFDVQALGDHGRNLTDERLSSISSPWLPRRSGSLPRTPCPRRSAWASAATRPIASARSRARSGASTSSA